MAIFNSKLLEITRGIPAGDGHALVATGNWVISLMDP